MSAYDTWLDANTAVQARWNLNDGTVADAATCADTEGSADLTYLEHSGSFSTVASPILDDTQGVVFNNDPRAFLGSVPASLDPAADRTILIWAWVDDASGFDYLYSCYKDATNYLHIYRANDTIEVRSEIGGVIHSVTTTASSIASGGWYMIGVHIGGLLDRKITINGEDRTAASINTLGATTVGVCLAARTDRSTDLTGRLAHVAVTENITVAQALSAYQAATVVSSGPAFPSGFAIDFPSPFNLSEFRP